MTPALVHLHAELGWVRSLLARLVAATPSSADLPPSPSYLRREDVEPLVADAPSPEDARRHADAVARDGLPLTSLQTRFELDEVQFAALLLALTHALVPGLRPVFAYLQDDMAARAPRVELLIQLAGSEAAWTSLAPDRPWAWIPGLSLEPAKALDLRTLHADERLVRYVRGEACIPEALVPWLASPIREPSAGARSSVETWLRTAPQAVGHFETADAVDVQSALAARTRVVAFDPTAGATGSTKVEEALLLAAGHALLTDAVLAVGPDLEGAEVRGAILTVAAWPALRLALLAHEELDLRPLLGRRPVHASTLPALTEDERRRHWARLCPEVDEDVRASLARTFAMGATLIDRAATLARSTPDTPIEAACWAVTRAPTRGLARSIESKAGWDDLVAPVTTRLRLQEIVDAVRFRERMFGEWQVRGRVAGQPGLVALFHGPPGTGKTLSASVIATALGLPLLWVDLAGLVSKYIGETEKNLREVFRSARRTHAVLFFDEADSVFGKRTAVSDAHDRYANVQTSYLLQEVERYDGIAILATNFKVNIDPAFLRRFDTVVEFAAPDTTERRRLWRLLATPVTGPLSDDTLEALVSYKLSGGQIRNIVQQAALLAAPGGARPEQSHLLLATHHELSKAGRPQSSRNLGVGERETAVLRQKLRWRLLLAGHAPGPDDIELLARMLTLRDADFSDLSEQVAAWQGPLRTSDAALMACALLEKDGRMAPGPDRSGEPDPGWTGSLRGLDGPAPEALREAALKDPHRRDAPR